LSLIVALFASIPFSGNAAQPDSFSLGAEVRLCDYTQDESSLDPDVESFGQGAYCQIPVAGAVISATSETGEDLGSCETETWEGPQGGVVNSCSIDGLEFNTDYQFQLDESTIPTGYDIVENPVLLSIGDEIPGGGETFPVSFSGTRGVAPSGDFQTDSFGITASVMLCDYTQDVSEADLASMGPGAYCQVEVDGASVAITADDGTELGSCVTNSTITPNGGVLNGCSVSMRRQFPPVSKLKKIRSWSSLETRFQAAENRAPRPSRVRAARCRILCK
jgi:hypothetical protein